MKLTKLTLENYRSFKGKHEIDFAPITLLFGANSAGKSSVIKAIKNFGQTDFQDYSGKFSNLSLSDAHFGEDKISIGLHFERVLNRKQYHDELFFKLKEYEEIAGSKGKQEAFDSVQEAFDSVVELIINNVRSFAIEKTISKEVISHSEEYLLENPSIKNNKFKETVFTTKIILNNEVFLTYPLYDGFENSDLEAVFSYAATDINKEHSILSSFKFKKNLEQFVNLLQSGSGESDISITHNIKSLIENKNSNDVDKIYDTFNQFKLYFSSEEEQESCFCLLLGIFSFLKLMYLKVNQYSLAFEHLGPLRKILGADFQFTGDEKSFFSDKEYSDDESYVGEKSWKKLSDSKKHNERISFLQNMLLEKVNSWLADRFHTPYEIDFQSVYTLAVDTPEKQRALNEGRINKEHFDILSHKLRIKNLFNGSITSAEEIGVGISQLTPVIVSALSSPAFSVEQPELHIHPRMQTVVGDLFIFAGLFEAAEADEEGAVAVTVKNLDGEEVTYYYTEKAEEDKSFILCETHSEHLLLRLLKRVREGILNPEDVAVTYIESDRGKSKVTRIGIDEEGDFTNQWPDGFFEERLDELF